MYRVRDLICKRLVSVAPEATVESAMDLLRLQQADVLPVVEAGAIVGLVDGLTLYRYHGELPVREVMLEPVAIDIDAPLGQAAALMLTHRLRQLPITEEGRLIGLLLHRDLLETWGASHDARTALPWQDQMRRWAAAHLAAGHEVAVLFVDLNDFGRLNKIHGHVAGDRALKAIAAAMKACVDPRLELLCRYGGDEFAVATMRSQEEAWVLARQIREEIARLPWKPDEPVVGVSIGLAGGKRRGPRPGDYAPATLDDLVNWASRASTHAKTEPGHLVIFEGSGPHGPEFTGEPAANPGLGEEQSREGGTGGAEIRVVVDTYSLSQGEAGVQATVSLRRGREQLRATATHAEDRLASIALATTAALQTLLIPNARLAVDDVRILDMAVGSWQLAVGSERDGTLPTANCPLPTANCHIVIALLTLVLPQTEERLLGAVHLQEDRYRSVINAVLDAVNRRIALFCRHAADLAADNAALASTTGVSERDEEISRMRRRKSFQSGTVS